MKGLIFVMIFISFSCKKDKSSDEIQCTLKVFPYGARPKEFDFNQGSFWIYKSGSSFDTITLYNKLVSSNYPYNMGGMHGSKCDTFTRDVYSEVYFKHSHYPSPQNDFFYSLNINSICLNKKKYSDDQSVYAFGTGGINGADTLRYSWFQVNKVWAEASYPSLTIQNLTYTNVDQMFYYPSYSNFKRAWWCPGVGLVKFEFLNVNSQVEIWELESYHLL